MQARYKKYTLYFKQPAGTSRGILKTKETYFLILKSDGKTGIGECPLFRGLSADDIPEYEEKLAWVCQNIQQGEKELLEHLREFPSIQFGIEQAFLSLKAPHSFELFPSEFSKGNAAIPINGLIWMGTAAVMKKRIKEKLVAGFTTLKLKVGALEFTEELTLLKNIRKEFSSNEVTLRVDANGAFSPQNTLEKLKRLSDYELHSIEQPIRAGQWEEMQKLCAITPLPIALDEELIGIFKKEQKEKLLKEIKPQYIILKPALVGGFTGSSEWIAIAEKQGVGWWLTSALESNIGLNAIAQYSYHLNVEMPQGLGTGGLFTNNFKSPLRVKKGCLHYDTSMNWEKYMAIE